MTTGISRRRRARRAATLFSLCSAFAASVAVPAGASARAHAPGHGIVSAARCANNRAAGPITWASPFGFSSSASILDVFEAQALGYFRDLCLSVRFITSTFTPDTLVSTGVAQFSGEGSAADTLAAVANGSRFVAISTAGNESLYALLTQPGITRLGQLKGKILAYHQVLPVALDEMLAAQRVPISSINLVNDNTYDPLLLTSGTYNALQAFRSNEPLELRAKHLAFREFTPGQFKIGGTMGVIVANADFLRRHRQVAADFLRADLKAFAYCAQHAVVCVAQQAATARAAGASYDVTLSLQRWRMESAIVGQSRLKGHGVGVETFAEWRPEAAALARFGVVAHVPTLARAEDTTLAASLYRGTSLIWP